LNRILVFALASVFLLIGCAASAKEGVEVREAWARPAAQGENGAVYFVIRSSTEDEITSVASDVAEAAEMHESMGSGDVMEMHLVESVPLGAGEDVSFEPGGLHIMLVRLKQELKPGDTIEITLHFKNHADLKVGVAVKDSP
jgi:periplasmic copper chaperone A